MWTMRKSAEANLKRVPDFPETVLEYVSFTENHFLNKNIAKPQNGIDRKSETLSFRGISLYKWALICVGL